jgi:hypothetical protein
VRITKVVGFLSLNPTKLVWHFAEFSTIFWEFSSALDQKAIKLRYDSSRIGPKIYTQHPDKKAILAIGPLAGEAAWLRPNPGKPAALPAGQAAGLDQGLT